MDVYKELKQDNQVFSDGYLKIKNFPTKNDKQNSNQVSEIQGYLNEIYEKYKKMDYNAPDLSDNQNLFKISPLLLDDIEIRKFFRSHGENPSAMQEYQRDVTVLDNMMTGLIEQSTALTKQQSQSGGEGTMSESGVRKAAAAGSMGVGFKKPVEEMLRRINMMGDASKKNYIESAKMIEHQVSIDDLMNNIRENDKYKNFISDVIDKKKEPSNFIMGGLEPAQIPFEFDNLPRIKKKEFKPNETILTSLNGDMGIFRKDIEKEQPKDIVLIKEKEKDKTSNFKRRHVSQPLIPVQRIKGEDVNPSENTNKNNPNAKEDPNQQYKRESFRINPLKKMLTKNITLPGDLKRDKSHLKNLMEKDKTTMTKLNQNVNTRSNVVSAKSSNYKGSQASSPNSRIKTQNSRENMEDEEELRRIAIEKSIKNKINEAKRLDEERIKRIEDLHNNRDRFLQNMLDKFNRTQSAETLYKQYCIYIEKHGKVTTTNRIEIKDLNKEYYKI